MYAKPRVFPAKRTGTNRAVMSANRVEEVTRELIAQEPFGRISMARIADLCGLARSTVYRKFADTAEILWAIAVPDLVALLRAALQADRQRFDAAARKLWTTPGLVTALAAPDAQPLRAKLAELAAAEIERATRRPDASVCGLVVSASWFALADNFSDRSDVSAAALSELFSLIYLIAFLTPEGLGAIARRQAKQAMGAFPAAVSVRESLADEAFIISMIDGKRYRSLTRHIARYGMSPQQYRDCFGLPADYPMTAPAHSARRRELASAMGLGTRRGRGAGSAQAVAIG